MVIADASNKKNEESPAIMPIANRSTARHIENRNPARNCATGEEVPAKLFSGARRGEQEKE